MSEDKPESTDDETSGSDQSGSAHEGEGIADEELPADVRPDEDNPLGRHPDQTGDSDDEIGADREGEPETAPMTEEDADYSEKSSDSDAPS